MLGWRVVDEPVPRYLSWLTFARCRCCRAHHASEEPGAFFGLAPVRRRVNGTSLQIHHGPL